MLIPLTEAIKRHDLHIRGIIHVGAHHGQELNDYKANDIHDIVFIEPCAPAFKVLQSIVGEDERVMLFNCACGDEEGQQEIYVETHNTGQSNSLLKPLLHLTYYPQIQFNDREMVPVRRLDNLPINRSKYNLLMMDTQGAELLVLKGAVETLSTIDYIYTEVNSQELYLGNAMVQDLDKFLADFKRVESKWVGTHGWGDSIYIRKTLINSNN